MLITIVLIAAVALGWPLACRSNRDTKPSVDSSLERRMRWVERHPGEVNTGDIERILTSHGLSVGDVRKVSERAFALGIKPFTMWMFMQAYGARELAVAVAAEVSHDDLLEHLAAGTLPNFGELEVFAALNGLVAASEHPGKGARRSAGRHDAPPPGTLSRRRGLEDLDIHEPGDWTITPDTLSSFEVTSEEPVADWEFGDGKGRGQVA